MTIGAVYASDLSRVRISCSAAPAAADHAVIERSVDQITWFTVRGGDAVPLVGAACTLDDYEFVPGQVNYYRARYVDMADPTVVSVGTESNGNNASVTPGMPAGVADGDILVMKAAIRNTSATINTPTNWTLFLNGGNFRIYTRIYSAGVTAPTVTFSGGVAGDDTSARITAVRNSDFSVSGAVQSNSSAQNVAYAAAALAELSPDLLLMIAWKQAAASGTSVTGWSLVSNHVPSAGNDMTMAWWSKEITEDEPAGSMTVTGGSAAVSKSTVLRFTRRPYVSQETASVTPTITEIWLKNVQKPFLNRTLTVTDWGTEESQSRSGVFDIVSRSLPVGVTELLGSRRFTITATLTQKADSDEFSTILSAGDSVMLQVPPDCDYVGGYFVIDRVSKRRGQSVRSPRRYFDLTLIEVAAPSSVLVGTTVTWQSVISTYATWADLIADNPTWADLLDRIGTPSDVVVP